MSIVQTGHNGTEDSFEAVSTRRGKRARLAELAKRLHLRGRNHCSHCPSGLDELDRALGGGFALPGVHELIAPTPGSPARSIAMRLAANAADNRHWIIYIDTAGDFYPPAAARMGVPLGRMIVIRTTRTLDALWVCEQALRCGAVAAVVLTLRDIEPHVSRRLQLAAEAGGTLGLLIRTEDRGGHTFACTRLRLDPCLGETDARRLRVSVLKVRERSPTAPFEMELHDEAGVVSPHAVSAERPGAARRRTAAG